MGVIHPRGQYFVDMPYESTKTIGHMEKHRPELYDWIKENCAPVQIRTTVFYTGWDSEKERNIKKARLHFFTKDEALLFKLTWCGR